jgi:hypothetical protein
MSAPCARQIRLKAAVVIPHRGARITGIGVEAFVFAEIIHGMIATPKMRFKR